MAAVTDKAGVALMVDMNLVLQTYIFDNLFSIFRLCILNKNIF